MASLQDMNHGDVYILSTVLIVCVLLFLSQAFVALPKWFVHLTAGVTGACAGAHVTVQAVYFSWSDDGRNGPLVFGLLAENRDRWCTQRSSCQIFYTTFCILVLVSFITQYFVHSATKLARPARPFEPKKFRHPNECNACMSLEDGDVPVQEEQQDEKEVDDGSCLSKCLGKEDPENTWSSNLGTPSSAWIFLFLVVGLCCAATYAFSFFVYWGAGTKTNFFVGLLYILTNAFCLWSIIEFFMTTLWFHAVRLFLGMPLLPRQDFSQGLPRTGRTILAYCLLSKQKESSEETFKTACDAHLANLDPKGRITTAVVSVSSSLSVVECEMDCRDEGRKRIKRVLTAELQALLEAFPQGLPLAAADSQLKDRMQQRVEMNRILTSLPEGCSDRVDYWLQVLESNSQIASEGSSELQAVLEVGVEEAAMHFVYLHRNCKILKKPGQYQDLMVLGSTGNNQAYTYLEEDYGHIGRKAGSTCFGFEGNLSDDSETQDRQAFRSARTLLEERGREDVLLVAGYGTDAQNRYFYTMVLDSDTVCPPESIRKLVETAEHPANKAFGIINANLANDYGADDSCTWHMWRNALMEVSTVNLQRGQFWIFNRVGFYGKGLVRNDLYMTRLIGKPGQVIEALPIDILSHDTVEAKLLQPGIAIDVTLYEDVARNPISSMSQSTRWMLGEVRNGCYHSDGTYAPVVKLISQLHSLITKHEWKSSVWIRWRDVPCAASAEYLSHTGFRLFHAGPGILLINVFTTVLAEQGWGLQLRILPIVGFSAFLFTVLALFIIPKGFLILDKLPSLNLGRYLLCTRKASKIGDGSYGRGHSFEKDDGAFIVGEELSISSSQGGQKLNRCSILMRQSVLALIEVVLSILLFSPELILGVIRMVRGVWAQATGSASWKPQDAVEKEIEQCLSLWFVFKKTWVVFLCGILYLAYVCIAGAARGDFLVWLVVVPWLLYPFSTYVMCLPVPQVAKGSWIWTWVMDIKRAEITLD
eukprot:TRINITY_DN23825_c0_g1_i1.p1 TRINITY_DN23825_c0_g1~~TRINITY_DN23825_c0_g1_i1.p1  ORF type:complete len:1136 (-),score=191.46 TRINITY_DN23825_c0_g1_i1:236-3196(-)